MVNSQRYTDWFKSRGCPFPSKPDEKGFFHRGSVRAILPILRVYWKGPVNCAEVPLGIDSWPKLGDGYSRFFRADQILDWLSAIFPPDTMQETFAEALNKALEVWLVPVGPPLSNHDFLLERRIDAVRLMARADIEGSAKVRWSRVPRLFPDQLRRDCPEGVDLVHTPESDRAGLTRYLTSGAEIDDHGEVVSFDHEIPWGPSTICIPHKLHTAPRRLMLGASLQSRAVPLAGVGDTFPPSANLLVSFSVCNGLTHEDAIVVSNSGAEKLTRTEIREVEVLIPAIAHRTIEVDVSGTSIARGLPLARAWIDMYALGWRQRDLPNLGWPTQDGWLEIALPAAKAPVDGTLIGVVRQRNLRTPRWRERLVFKIAARMPLGVGDKLATPFGVKGVVAKILDDEQMPKTPHGQAEIVISPIGVLRRGALGQFKEAASETRMENGELPRWGVIRVMRQPQDAALACRAQGPLESHQRGQRFGEMEFWALMAHGAPKIAAEMLSFGRSTAPWAKREANLSPIHAKQNMRALCKQAMNR